MIREERADEKKSVLRYLPIESSTRGMMFQAASKFPGIIGNLRQTATQPWPQVADAVSEFQVSHERETVSQLCLNLNTYNIKKFLTSDSILYSLVLPFTTTKNCTFARVKERLK